jgi:hypothetical protein
MAFTYHQSLTVELFPSLEGGGGLLCRIFSGEFSVMTNPESTVDSGDEQEDSHGYDDD